MLHQRQLPLLLRHNLHGVLPEPGQRDGSGSRRDLWRDHLPERLFLLQKPVLRSRDVHRVLYAMI